MAVTVWLEEMLSVCERLLSVWRWTYSTHAGSECVVVVGVWWNVIDVIVCLLVLTRPCCTIDTVCGLLVGFQWLVQISWRMGLLEEQEGAVVGVFWLLPSGSASSPLSTLNAK